MINNVIGKIDATYTYWVSSRIKEDNGYLRLRCTFDDQSAVGYCTLKNTSNIAVSAVRIRIRPIITLQSNINLVDKNVSSGYNNGKTYEIAS